MIIGLTGGSGAGKTDVSNILSEHGIYVIDADLVSRQTTEKGSACLAELTERFGNEILDSSGALARRRLGEIVFADRAKLAALNDITHKYIIRSIDSQIKKNAGRDTAIDAALLIESGLAARCDYVIAVIADHDTRINRIMKRDGISHAQAANRLDSQKKDSFYIENSDFLIYNNSSKSLLRKQVKEVLLKLTGKEKEEEKRKTEAD